MIQKFLNASMCVQCQTRLNTTRLIELSGYFPEQVNVVSELVNRSAGCSRASVVAMIRNEVMR